MSQMKEQLKITATNISETDLSNMPDRECEVITMKVLTGVEKRVEDITGILNIDIKEN